MSPRDGARRVTGASASIGAMLLAVLIPKCPLCVAAALSALGVGASFSAWLSPALRPMGLVLVAVTLLVFARGEWRRRRRRACGCAR